MMRRFLFVLCALLTLAAGPLACVAFGAPGDFDSSFGVDGVKYIDFGMPNGDTLSITAEPGRHVLCRRSSASTSTYLARLTPYGDFYSGVPAR